MAYDLSGVTVFGLLLTLVILFAFQGQKIIDNPLHITLIAIPLTIQTFFIFFLAYLWAKIWKLPHDIASCWCSCRSSSDAYSSCYC